MQHDKNACFTKIKIISIINFAAHFVACENFLYLLGCFLLILLEMGDEWIQINELIYLIEYDEVRWDFCEHFLKVL